jgi:hypothetical protein
MEALLEKAWNLCQMLSFLKNLITHIIAICIFVGCMEISAL